MSRLVELYPSDWRDRYEAEFRALLADRPPTLGERVDIVVGAVDAHLHSQSLRPSRTRDRLGFAPLMGFLWLIVAYVLASTGPIQFDEYGSYRDGSAAALPLLLASILLSVGIVALGLRLPADATGARLAVWVAAFVGPTWALMPWVAPLALVLILAVLGLAVGARRAGVLPTWTVVVLTAALVVPAGLIAALHFLPWWTFRVVGIDYLLVIGPMSIMWLVIGVAVLWGPTDRRMLWRVPAAPS